MRLYTVKRSSKQKTLDYLSLSKISFFFVSVFFYQWHPIQIICHCIKGLPFLCQAHISNPVQSLSSIQVFQGKLIENTTAAAVGWHFTWFLQCVRGDSLLFLSPDSCHVFVCLDRCSDNKENPELGDSGGPHGDAAVWRHRCAHTGVRMVQGRKKVKLKAHVDNYCNIYPQQCHK